MICALKNAFRPQMPIKLKSRSKNHLLWLHFFVLIQLAVYRVCRTEIPRLLRLSNLSKDACKVLKAESSKFKLLVQFIRLTRNPVLCRTLCTTQNLSFRRGISRDVTNSENDTCSSCCTTGD